MMEKEMKNYPSKQRYYKIIYSYLLAPNYKISCNIVYKKIGLLRSIQGGDHIFFFIQTRLVYTLNINASTYVVHNESSM